MKRNWSVKRDLVEHDHGQRRWDQAYQLLMQITSAPIPVPLSGQLDDSPTLNPLEESNDDCPICSSFDPAATADPDD